jgi:putative hydrolase of the HAD superfamily
MHRQVAGNGIAAHCDAVLFSSEVGRRKPAPELYRAALDRLGVEAEATLYVGDRVLEDYCGPRRVGMRAVLCTELARSQPPPGVPAIARLSDVESLL